MRKRNNHPMLRRGLLALFVLAAGVIQNTFLSSLRPGVWLLAPVTVCIVLYEKEFAGTFFGIFAGALWDLASPVPDGVYALCFAVFSCVCGLLAKRVFRSTLPAAMLLGLCFTAAIGMIPVIYAVACGGAQGLFSILLHEFFLPVLIAAILLPAFYYPVTGIERRFHAAPDVRD